jgi:hypothetical protein
MLLFRTDSRKHRAIWVDGFFQAFAGFFWLRRRALRAAEFAAPAGPARPFVLRRSTENAEKAAKSAIVKTGPLFASADPNPFDPDYRRASIGDIQDGLPCELYCVAGQGGREQGG